MTVEHAAEDQGGHRQRLVVGVAHEQAEVEAVEAAVGRRALTSRRRRVEEQRHVELHEGAVEVVEPAVVELEAEVGADVGRGEAEVP